TDDATDPGSQDTGAAGWRPCTAAAPGPRAQDRRRWIVLLGVAVLLTGCGAVLLLRHLSASALRDQLPPLPELSDAPRAMAHQIREADAAARKRVHSADRVGLLGMVYHANLFYEEAGACYRVASGLAPRDYRWPYYRALLHETVGRADRSLPLLGRTVELSRDAPWVRRRLGNVALKLGELDAARQAFGEIADTDTHRQHGLLGLAEVARRERRWQEVVELLSPALAEDPSFGPARHVLASAYEALGMSERAREVLPPRKGVATTLPIRDPDSDTIDDLSCSPTHLRNAATLAQRVEPSMHREGELLMRLVAVAPEDLDGHLALCRWNHRAAKVSQERGLASEAERHLEQALAEARTATRLGPDCGAAHAALGVVLMSIGDVEPAITHMRRALELDPNMPLVHRDLAVILMATDRYEDAVEHAEALVRESPRDPSYLNCLAIAAKGSGDADRALALWREVVEVDPAHESARLNLASELLSRGEYSLAEAHVGIVLENDPQNAVARELASVLPDRQAAGDG
ncbi:MAG: tetratricopeptide repeat protein, partial [Armatimonadota bacterium]